MPILLAAPGSPEGSVTVQGMSLVAEPCALSQVVLWKIFNVDVQQTVSDTCFCFKEQVFLCVYVKFPFEVFLKKKYPLIPLIRVDTK